MTTLTLAEARAQLSRLVDEAVTTHERFEVTKNGRRAAVLLSADDFDAMTETLDILSDPTLVAAIREGEAEVAAGDVHSLDDVAEALRAAGRLPA